MVSIFSKLTQSTSHALSHAMQCNKPVCFVTVSTRLRDDLERRYIEALRLSTKKSQIIEFFSSKQMLEKLANLFRVQYNDLTSFEKYWEAKYISKHTNLELEVSTVENEVSTRRTRWMH